MKLFKKFKVSKKEEIEKIEPKKPFNFEAEVKLESVEEYKDKIRFIFFEDGNSEPFWLIMQKDEEELKKLFKILKEADFQAEYKAEKEAMELEKVSIKEAYEENKKSILEDDRIKKQSTRDKKLQEIIENFESVIKELKPLTPSERFESADLDDSDLIGKSLKVYALPKEKKGKNIRLIQSWQEVV